MAQKEGFLALSTNRGRYSIGDEHGVDISSGMFIEVFLGGQWIGGSVEHDPYRYANPSYRGGNNQGIEGYYFWADDESGVCGLCVGMRVRMEV